MMRNHPLYTSATLLLLPLACGDDQPASPSQATDGTTSSSMTSSTSGSPSTTTEGTTDTDQPASTTTGPMGCMEDGECTNASRPLCIDEVCEPCPTAAESDTACAELDAARRAHHQQGCGELVCGRECWDCRCAGEQRRECQHPGFDVGSRHELRRPGRQLHNATRNNPSKLHCRQPNQRRRHGSLVQRGRPNPHGRPRHSDPRGMVYRLLDRRPPSRVAAKLNSPTLPGGKQATPPLPPPPTRARTPAARRTTQEHPHP